MGARKKKLTQNPSDPAEVVAQVRKLLELVSNLPEMTPEQARGKDAENRSVLKTDRMEATGTVVAPIGKRLNRVLTTVVKIVVAYGGIRYGYCCFSSDAKAVFAFVQTDAIWLKQRAFEEFERVKITLADGQLPPIVERRVLRLPTLSAAPSDGASSTCQPTQFPFFHKEAIVERQRRKRLVRPGAGYDAHSC
jgi:hypothetical protein